MLALAGLLVFAPSNSHAQAPGSSEGKIELILDGWCGNGIDFDVYIGIRPKNENFDFNCGFTARFYVGDAAYNWGYTGEAHFGRYSNCYEAPNSTVIGHYFPKDDGHAFLHLTKQTVPWPTGLCLMLVEFIPDNSEEKDTFCQIELDARPFINRLSQVTVLGDPVGRPFAEWYVNKTAPL